MVRGGLVRPRRQACALDGEAVVAGAYGVPRSASGRRSGMRSSDGMRSRH
jgi:hypothetical protein